MLDRPAPDLRITAAPVPPVEALVLGRPVDEAVVLLGRLFNLCRSAQELGAWLAFGLTPPEGWAAALARDLARDHMLRLGVLLPGRLGLTPWVTPAPDVAQMARGFFEGGAFPQTGAEFEGYLNGPTALAGLLRAVAARFGPQQGVVDLPGLGQGHEACENSPALRHAGHPVMMDLEQRAGRGPMWRLVGRVLDLIAALEGRVPEPQARDGWIAVPAARGAYLVRGSVRAGHVTGFERITPTDHMLAPGGMLAQALAGLTAEQAAVMVDILDPCRPVQVMGGTDHA